MATVLLVDDDRALRALVRTYLDEEGIIVREVGTGEDAIVAVRHRPPDLVLLDVRLPDIDGFEVLRRLHATELLVPVMMMTSLTDEVDQLVGFRLGAIDYITKPVSPKILAAKIKAFLMRAQPIEPPRRTAIGPLLIDHAEHRVLVDDDEVPLTRSEFDLLAALASHPGWVYDRDHLLRELWHHDGVGLETRVVDQHVANLRRKLEAAGVTGLVETVRGVGYRLADPVSS